MHHDMIIAHPTPEPGLWLVAAPAPSPDDPGAFRALLIITRLPEVDGLWHVEGSEDFEGFADVREAFAEAVHRVIPLDERPTVMSATCPMCGDVLDIVADHGFVWHASTGKVSAPPQSIFQTMEEHVEVCPIQVDDVALGWLTACGWLVEDDGGTDRRNGPFTEEAKNVALRDVHDFLQAAGREDVEVYLRDVAPMTERYGDGNAHEWLGHDIYLTQHHHGTGFWDREWLDDDLGERLTEAAQTLRERHALLTEDEKVDVE